MSNERRKFKNVLLKQIDFNDLHVGIVEYYRPLTQLVECVVDIQETSYDTGLHIGEDSYCIFLNPEDETFSWVHEVAHYLYTLLTVKQKEPFEEAVVQLCLLCKMVDLDNLLDRVIKSYYAGYRYSALTDAYGIFWQEPHTIGVMSSQYIQRHPVGYPKKRVYTEAWASVCELIMYDITPPKELYELYDIATCLLEDLMFELFN